MDKHSAKGRKIDIRAFFLKIKRRLTDRSCDSRSLIFDLTLFSVGFLLSRCHLLFGIRPVGLSFVCTTQAGVWPTLFGAVIGYLSLGSSGIIFAVATAVAIFLRVAFGYSDMSGLFCEAPLIRMSISVISSFAVAVFEVLRVGLTESSLLFGLSMIIISPLLSFIFSGLFIGRITLSRIISEERSIFALSNTDRQEKYEIIFFQVSALMLLFFIGLSLRGVDILGISLSYLFSAFITLMTAKRFGAMRGLAAGFASSLGISGVLSVSFALAGLVSGALFYLGTGYALIGGCVALCAFL